MPTHEWTPCELYQAYECARDDAELALRRWNFAGRQYKREAFAVYRAAVERENAAAFAWLHACAAYDAGVLVDA
jgi:hypothetical protein